MNFIRPTKHPGQVLSIKLADRTHELMMATGTDRAKEMYAFALAQLGTFQPHPLSSIMLRNASMMLSYHRAQQGDETAQRTLREAARSWQTKYSNLQYIAHDC